MPSDKILEAPWTPEQVDKLNAYQKLGWVHEYTCPNHHENVRVAVLFATTDGWICPGCNYRQPWAHKSSLAEMQNPLDAAFAANAEKQRAVRTTFDHAFEPGAYGCCRRCGSDKPH